MFCPLYRNHTREAIRLATGRHDGQGVPVCARSVLRGHTVEFDTICSGTNQFDSVVGTKCLTKMAGRSFLVFCLDIPRSCDSRTAPCRHSGWRQQRSSRQSGTYMTRCSGVPSQDGSVVVVVGNHGKWWVVGYTHALVHATPDSPGYHSTLPSCRRASRGSLRPRTQ